MDASHWTTQLDAIQILRDMFPSLHRDGLSNRIHRQKIEIEEIPKNIGNSQETEITRLGGAINIPNCPDEIKAQSLFIDS